jgi:hypothetical protein
MQALCIFAFGVVFDFMALTTNVSCASGVCLTAIVSLHGARSKTAARDSIWGFQEPKTVQSRPPFVQINLQSKANRL